MNEEEMMAYCEWLTEVPGLRSCPYAIERHRAYLDAYHFNPTLTHLIVGFIAFVVTVYVADKFLERRGK